MTDLRLQRVIDAPVQRVYTAWTDPELLKQWLAPGNAAASRAVADVAVGRAAWPPCLTISTFAGSPCS